VINGWASMSKGGEKREILKKELRVLRSIAYLRSKEQRGILCLLFGYEALTPEGGGKDLRLGLLTQNTKMRIQRTALASLGSEDDAGDGSVDYGRSSIWAANGGGRDRKRRGGL